MASNTDGKYDVVKHIFHDRINFTECSFKINNTGVVKVYLGVVIVLLNQ